MLSAERIVEILTERLTGDVEPLQVYWCRVEVEARDEMAKAVRSLAGSTPIIPVVVRKQLFFDPNAVLSDLNQLISDNRIGIAELGIASHESIAIVLLARSDFHLAQTGSPIVLPEWFPVCSGLECYVSVRDLLFDVDCVSLNAPESRAADIAAQLLRLEKAILVRLRAVRAERPSDLNALWARIAKIADCTVDQVQIESLLKDYGAHLDGVEDGRAYRPAAKNNRSVLSHLVALVQRSSPEQLLSFSTDLALGLGIDSTADTRQTMAALLLRPTQKMAAQAKFAHSLLASIFGGYQFLNGVAHASDYPKFSAAFLYLNSKDLRGGLQASANVLERLQPPRTDTKTS